MNLEASTAVPSNHYPVFMSYRRNDRPGYVARLSDDIKARFGDVAFRDVDSIPAGDQWQRSLKRRVAQSRVVLALIGEGWLEELERRRGAIDHVRLELNYAHELGIPVIPVLFGDVQPLPEGAELGDLHWLPSLQAHELRDNQGRWAADSERLLTILASTAALSDNASAPSAELRIWQDRKWWIGAVAIPLIAAIIAVVFSNGGDTTVEVTNGVGAGNDVNVSGDLKITSSDDQKP